MPIQVSQNSPQGFLREINFLALGKTVVTDLLGEVEWPDWLKMELGSRPDAMTREFLLTVKFTIEPHSRQIELEPGRIRQVGARKEWIVGGEIPVPNDVVRELRDTLPELVKNWVPKVLRAAEDQLYEVDPRIGWRSHGLRDGADTLLPRCPLFDPRRPFSRSGFPIADGQLGARQTPPWFKAPRCPFCREDHRRPEAPVWAGGNLMWVHPRCWRAS